MKYTAFLLFLLSCSIATAQKHDYVWTGGENINNPAITGGFLIDFKELYPAVISHPREFNLFHSSACISDTSGKLQVYTNGCDIVGARNDEILPNGNDINPGYVNQFQCHTEDGVGYYTSGVQSSLFLPLPDSSGIYYLFHKRIKYVYNPFDVLTDMLFYSIVDMNWMGGRGKVSEKNIPLMADTLAAGMMTAVKHANGKDWWIVTPRNTENQIYCFLFTHEGITDTTLQYIGFNLDQDGSCQITFTPDGSKLITCNPYSGLGIFDFDRATGLLSNYRSVDIAPYIWQWTSFTGCAVSPNNRFVYVSSTFDLLQYDLTAPDIAASRIHIGTYDGGENPLATTFGQCHLAPDCKIYLQTGQQAENLHIIHRPNELGTTCEFEQRGLVLTNANRGSLPYFPNYRLGPADNPGEPCTTVTATTAPPTPLPGFSVFPNPAVSDLRIVANRQFSGEGILRLYSGAGALVREATFDASSGTTATVAVTDLPQGLYYYQVWCEGKLVRADKVAVVRGE